LPDDSRKDRAAVQLSKLQREQDAKKNMSEYEANAAAVRAKTARLKALREAQVAATPAPVAAAPAKKKASGKAKKEASGNLSEWLKDRQVGGRNS
jgi:hypothetical protein